MDDVFARFLEMIPNEKEFLFQFLDLFPVPIEIFSPDGFVVFINRAGQKFINITDPGLIVGKYNLLNDPVCNDQMGLREGINKAFLRGESVALFDVMIPIQDLIDRKIISEKPFEKGFADWYLFPIMRGDKTDFIVFILYAKKLYFDIPDLTKAKEYLDSHWREKFDAHAVAKSVNMSVSRLYNIFKKHAGMTPGEYYRRRKVEQIIRKLADKNLSVKMVFAACNEDSHGAFAKVFKIITGFSPTQYRKRYF